VCPSQGSSLNGNDALYSIVQMPSGVPVATVAIDGAKNAAILAARILAVADPELLEKLKKFNAQQRESVEKKDARLQETGYRGYK
jgi:5-(carboxyamino)imidazole ribonucleotide mutase